MKEIGVRGKRWLKGFHVTFACLWVGGGLTLTLMQLAMHATTGGELYGIDRSMKFIDDFIIIPGALGSLLTGLLYSLFTNWGFFKHNWITVKWVTNIGDHFRHFLARPLDERHAADIRDIRPWRTIQPDI